MPTEANTVDGPVSTAVQSAAGPGNTSSRLEGWVAAGRSIGSIGPGIGPADESPQSADEKVVSVLGQRGQPDRVG